MRKGRFKVIACDCEPHLKLGNCKCYIRRLLVRTYFLYSWSFASVEYFCHIFYFILMSQEEEERLRRRLPQ